MLLDVLDRVVAIVYAEIWLVAVVNFVDGYFRVEACFSPDIVSACACV